jgi:hypothetical protein
MGFTMRNLLLLFTVAVIPLLRPAEAAELDAIVQAATARDMVSARWNLDHHDLVSGTAPGRLQEGLERRRFIPIPVAKPTVWPLPRRKPDGLLPKTLCRMIEIAAKENEVPIGLFTRLIWTESRFRFRAVSPAGAKGIAQFMPATAAEQGLEDPFNPEQSLWVAARLLNQLKQRFGNFGLAAAAYNAGPKRVSDWLRSERPLPKETRSYVKAITGRPARSWVGSTNSTAADAIPHAGAWSCMQTASALAAGDV